MGRNDRKTVTLKYCITWLERRYLVPLTAEQARARLSQTIKKQNESLETFARSVTETKKSETHTMIDKVILKTRPKDRKRIPATARLLGKRGKVTKVKRRRVRMRRAKPTKWSRSSG